MSIVLTNRVMKLGVDIDDLRKQVEEAYRLAAEKTLTVNEDHSSAIMAMNARVTALENSCQELAARGDVVRDMLERLNRVEQDLQTRRRPGRPRKNP